MEHTATVPEFTHSTTQNILEINKSLIKILLEYQNNGWLDDEELKIYQQRLSTNLSFLATVADCVMKKIPLTKVLENTPDMQPVSFPDRMLSQKQNQNTKTSIGSLNRIMNPSPPAMVNDLNTSQYVPVQPFVLPSNVPKPHLESTLPYIPKSTAENVLQHRLQNFPMNSSKNLNTSYSKDSNIPSQSINIDSPQDDLEEDDEEYIPTADEELLDPTLNPDLDFDEFTNEYF